MRPIPLWEMTEELSGVAMGRLKAHTVIRQGILVNVNTAEIIANVDVAIYKGRIAYVGEDASHTIGQETEIFDTHGLYLCPGFLDGHLHVESSMVGLTEFSKTVLCHGTTTIFMDPHEIANVLGVKGIKMMVEEGKNLPLKVFATIPSCVPAAAEFEDAGASIELDDIAEMLSWPQTAGLGEMMNYPGIIFGDCQSHRKVQITLKAGKPVTGHFASPSTGIDLQAYIASGCSSCHESTRKEEALAKMRLGMYAMLREGSAWQDVKQTVKAITEKRIDSRFAILVSDDTHPESLLARGHINYVMRRAIEEGLEPVKAIQMVTINPARYFNKEADLGSISPGKCADILVLKDLAGVEVDKVFANGKLVAQEGRLLLEPPAYKYPDWARSTVNIKHPLKPDDFNIEPPQGAQKDVVVKVIKAIESKAVTQSITARLDITETDVPASIAADIIKIACIERHKGTGTIGLGFVTGFALKGGAVASTVAHDSHNLLIIGTNNNDMALAANELAAAGGGMIVVRDGKVLALLKLPVAGLMSEQSIGQVADNIEKLTAAWQALGCTMKSPFMTMSLLSLPVIPQLRLTNRGLVDVDTFAFTDLFV
ncbi:MAG TPA: adenine deaminase [Firmicutes bacterium]|nr:adenine deaminase [Bacillota bacterium]